MLPAPGVPPALRPQHYMAAKQYEVALDNIRWATDYFIKCVGDGTEIVGQVGNGQSDHSESPGKLPLAAAWRVMPAGWWQDKRA